jgi:CRP/FNR family transcriptional regulator, dissimilatory nitrate respiration regulator
MDEGKPAAALGAPFSLRRLAAGESLFRQGDRVFAVFQVASGRMRLVRHTIDSHPVVLHDAKPGELFAEAALFADTYHCDAVAALASEVRVLERRQLLRAFRGDPEIAIRFMAELARQVQALRSGLALRSVRSARERVLQYLELHAEPDDRTVRLPGTLMELAAEIGLSHEALYRTLRGLERDGRIARPSRGVLRLTSAV